MRKDIGREKGAKPPVKSLPWPTPIRDASWNRPALQVPQPFAMLLNGNFLPLLKIEQRHMTARGTHVVVRTLSEEGKSFAANSSCNISPNEIVHNNVPAALSCSQHAERPGSCRLKHAAFRVMQLGMIGVEHTLSGGTHPVRSKSTASRVVRPLQDLEIV